MQIKTKYALEEYLKQRAEKRSSADKPMRKPSGFMKKQQERAELEENSTNRLAMSG